MLAQLLFKQKGYLDDATCLESANRLGSNSGESNMHPATCPTLQPKLKVGLVNDQDEQAADRRATQGVNQLNPPTTQRQSV